MDEFEQAALDQLKQAGASKQSFDRAVQALREHRQLIDRCFIVKWIVYLYVASISAAIFYLIVRAAFSHEDRFSDISELIKVAVLPVLTLVVGYYFGT